LIAFVPYFSAAPIAGIKDPAQTRKVPELKTSDYGNRDADRQLVRKDGTKVLNALYELKTDDGSVITVNNQVLIDKRADGAQYAFPSST
jgi:hypothetical protein